MDNLIDNLNDISKVNVIYTVLLIANANSLTFYNPILEFLTKIIMEFNTTITFLTSETGEPIDGDEDEAGDATYGSVVAVSATNTSDQKPSLLLRMAKRLALYSENLIGYIHNQFNEHTATSIASFSVLIILLSIICCFIISLMREEERKIKEQYRKLNAGSSQSFLASNSDSGGNNHSSNNSTSNNYQYHQSFNQFHSGGYQKIGNHQFDGRNALNGSPFVPSSSPSLQTRRHSKVRIIELRRETYFGLVRLLKPGCRTLVLLCDSQSKAKLLSKYYNCVYPYRKNKTLQFAFLLIEKNIGWYKDLLKLALNEKRHLKINPINCIGTVLALNGFKKYFSVYHASDSRWNPDEPLMLLEETLLDNLPEWLERLFAGKVNRYYMECWPDRMR